jgi:hypothetical protein
MKTDDASSQASNGKYHFSPDNWWESVKVKAIKS